MSPFMKKAHDLGDVLVDPFHLYLLMVVVVSIVY